MTKIDTKKPGDYTCDEFGDVEEIVYCEDTSPGFFIAKFKKSKNKWPYCINGDFLCMQSAQQSGRKLKLKIKHTTEEKMTIFKLYKLYKENKLAKEQEPEKEIYFKIIEERSGGIALIALNKNGEIISNILFITKTGQLYLNQNINKKTGLDLDENGRINLY